MLTIVFLQTIVDMFPSQRWMKKIFPSLSFCWLYMAVEYFFIENGTEFRPVHCRQANHDAAYGVRRRLGLLPCELCPTTYDSCVKHSRTCRRVTRWPSITTGEARAK
jgi:hypothetical protein